MPPSRRNLKKLEEAARAAAEAKRPSGERTPARQRMEAHLRAVAEARRAGLPVPPEALAVNAEMERRRRAAF